MTHIVGQSDKQIYKKGFIKFPAPIFSFLISRRRSHFKYNNIVICFHIFLPFPEKDIVHVRGFCYGYC